MQTVQKCTKLILRWCYSLQHVYSLDIGLLWFRCPFGSSSAVDVNKLTPIAIAWVVNTPMHSSLYVYI